jgi:hypothetical protein
MFIPSMQGRREEAMRDTCDSKSEGKKGKRRESKKKKRGIKKGTTGALRHFENLGDTTIHE